jgi:hypothetical protein
MLKSGHGSSNPALEAQI